MEGCHWRKDLSTRKKETWDITVLPKEKSLIGWMDIHNKVQGGWECGQVQGPFSCNGVYSILWNWLPRDICSGCQTKFYPSIVIIGSQPRLVPPPTRCKKFIPKWRPGRRSVHGNSLRSWDKIKYQQSLQAQEIFVWTQTISACLVW